MRNYYLIVPPYQGKSRQYLLNLYKNLIVITTNLTDNELRSTVMRLFSYLILIESRVERNQVKLNIGF